LNIPIPAQQTIHRFSGSNGTWWGAGKLLEDDGEQGLLMCVIVPEGDLLGDLETLWFSILLITTGVLFIAFIRAMVLGRKYSKPLEFLVRSSQKISKGDFEADMDVQSDIYEVQELEKAHDYMRSGLKTLMKMENDIQIARDIQQKTFPRSLPGVHGYEIAAWNAPAEETGGDTYDVVGYSVDADTGEIRIREGQCDNALLLVSDATGHGIGPALSVTQVRAMMRMRVRINPDLPLLIMHINAQLHTDLPGGRFVSAWFGKIDAKTNHLHSFSAGQAPLFHYSAGTGSMKILGSDIFPLGIDDALPHTEINQIPMARGDIFAVLSDGILEAMGPDQALFGQDRVNETLTRHSHESPQALIRRIRTAVEAFTGNTAAGDDQTILIIKRN